MGFPKLPRLTKEQNRLWRTLQFVLRFTALSIPMYLVIWLGIDLMPMQLLVADHASGAISALGFTVARDGLILIVGADNPFIFFIGPDCTGWKSMLCFIALVFASLGVSMRKRLLGVAVGIPLIYLGNIARIIVVVGIESAYGLLAAKVFHDWLWQAGLIALVLVLWLGWLRSDDIRSRTAHMLKKGKGKRSRHKHIIKLKEK